MLSISLARMYMNCRYDVALRTSGGNPRIPSVSRIDTKASFKLSVMVCNINARLNLLLRLNENKALPDILQTNKLLWIVE